MIKMKNILSENMRRFGTKNLNEQKPVYAPPNALHPGELEDISPKAVVTIDFPGSIGNFERREFETSDPKHREYQYTYYLDNLRKAMHNPSFHIKTTDGGATWSVQWSKHQRATGGPGRFGKDPQPVTHIDIIPGASYVVNPAKELLGDRTNQASYLFNQDFNKFKSWAESFSYTPPKSLGMSGGLSDEEARKLTGM